jgi:TPR repeat protein
MYHNGLGVQLDDGKANMWTIIASANGSEDAANLYDGVSQDAAIATAKALAAECINSGYKNCGD